VSACAMPSTVIVSSTAAHRVERFIGVARKGAVFRVSPVWVAEHYQS
jgi:hypothetical protein